MAGETNIPVGSDLAEKIFATALFAETQRECEMYRLLGSEPASIMSALSDRSRSQTSRHNPLVTITDLSKKKGDQVQCDFIGIINGLPSMGDEHVQGTSEPTAIQSMQIRVNQLRKAADGGSEMSQQRTTHNLRRIAKANLQDYFCRMHDQRIITHLAGARGSEDDKEWIVPQDDHAKFKAIMVNNLKPPSSNRYFVAGGGDDVTAIGATDALSLGTIGVVKRTLMERPFRPSPVQIMRKDGGMIKFYLLLVSQRQWHYMEERGGNVVQSWRQALAEARTRGSITTHPLFTGEAGLWNGVLIKPIERAIRFQAGATVKKTDSSSQAETSATVPSGITVDRAILLGGQALGHALANGQGPSGTPMRWSEIMEDHGNHLECAGGIIDGLAKFVYEGSDGKLTDFGCAVIDSYAPEIDSTAGETLRAALAGG